MTKKPLFLIHGLTGQRMTLERTARALAGDWFVVTYDCRGHGQTDHPAAYTLLDHGRDLLALIDALGYDGAAVLGQSMGSYVALQAAELAPDKLDALLLITPKAYDDGSGSSYQRLLREAGLDMATSSREARMAVLNRALWSPEVTPERLAELTPRTKMTGENVVALTPEETAAVNRALVGFDLRPGFKAVTCPTLVVSGTYDRINPPTFGREIAEGIPGAQYVELPGGHMLTLEHEEAYLRCVRDFLAGRGA
jgi:3-oxoadipate enol-lactonase